MLRLCGLCLFSLLSGCSLFRSAGSAEATTVTITSAPDSTEQIILKTSGRNIELTAPAGSQVALSKARSVQPKPTDEAATALAKPSLADSSSGKAAEVGKGVAGFGFGTFLVGVTLLVLGGALFLGPRFNLVASFIPLKFVKWSKVLGIVCMATGGAIIILPAIIDLLSDVILYSGIAAAVMGLLWLAWNIYQNERRQEKTALERKDFEHGTTVEIRR